MKPPSNLFQYVARCGSVTLLRASLPRFAQDLQLRQQDLESVIRRMELLGRVHTYGDTVQFASPSSAVAGESASLEAEL
jgi:hypothetical protein